jgi:cellulose synthase/poly-beta-1,6-N-acetylglucosamine synthase-like glycosyltransferase/peptidoglycan/xylan/chitin deacetylase (PgdA/CDA1 family)/spore germination protein YaaH
MNKQVFYDPHRKRWKRVRRIFDVLALAGLLLGAVFIINLWRMKPLPELLLQAPKRNYRALANRQVATKPVRRSAHRKTDRKPSDIPLNSGEGLRAAYYVVDDPASYSSLKQHISQVDLLFPEWIHVVAPDGNLTGYTEDNSPFAVVDSAGVHQVDREDQVAKTIAKNHASTEVFPLVNNYDPVKAEFLPSIGDFLTNAEARANFIKQIGTFLAANPSYHGISLDLEEVPTDAQPGFNALVAALYSDLHRHNLRLYVNTPVDDDDFNLKFLADNSDGLLLMDYDQHQIDSGPGPIAAQDWFVSNLKNVLEIVPKNKVICSLGSYGYDWTTAMPETVGRGRKKKTIPGKVLNSRNLSTQEAWQEAYDSEAQLELDDDSLNPHFAYDDEDAHVRHQVWFLDGVTVLNQMRAAKALGIQTFALWQLGSEDNSLWKIWDYPEKADPVKDLADVPPGYDVDTEGNGDILRITRRPQNGERTITMDDDATVPAGLRTITQESMDSYPLSYTVEQYGYNPKKIALTFDDGPDPEWTPKILAVLNKYNVIGTFLMIGENAENNTGLMKRVYRDGQEIGNHTFTHPDVSEISNAQVDLQLNLTERLFAAELGVQPLFFRPPYSIDQEPDTNDQAAPVDRIQAMGYTILGDKIDTNDWDEHPRKSPQEITDSVFAQIAGMNTHPWTKGSIILLHDGGGDRSATVAALPLLITSLRAHGYQIVPVSDLLGQTRSEIMPPLTPHQRWQARADAVTFFFVGFFQNFVVDLFFIGDVLMSARLLILGVCAVIERFRKRKNYATPAYSPRVAVVIPAYNEEKVIVRTIRSVMMSSYKNIRIIVIDDGSTDNTFRVARAAYPADIASGRLTVLTKANAGKAEALNFALQHIEEEIYVGIDADTVIAHDAVARLVPLFANPKVGAVAGNAKVGNRVNLWTRWQALEYITSQNFERRALDLFNVVPVVPGAIGAWRTAPVKEGGCYHSNTVAEDADLTMNLLEQNYHVIYEDQALAFTEAPVTADGLMRQRFRWSYGVLQAVWKHRGAITRNRAMGLFALPNILIFQIVLPLMSPLIDLMFLAGIIHFFIDKHFHPMTTSPDGFYKLLAFFLVFIVIDFVASALAFALERKHPASKGDGWLLFHIWIQRFTYRQLFSIVLFKTVKRAIDGKPFSWDKLDRTAKMSESTEKLTQGR